MFSVESRRHFVWQTPGTVSSLPLTRPVSLNPKAWKAGIKSDPYSHTFIRLGIFTKNHLFTAHTKNSPKEMLICSTFCDILKIPASYGVMQGRLGFYPGKIPPGAIKHFYGIMMLADFFGGNDKSNTLRWLVWRSETVVTIAVVWCDGHLESCWRLHIIKVKVDRCILCVKLLANLLSIDKYAIMYIINSLSCSYAFPCYHNE